MRRWLTGFSAAAIAFGTTWTMAQPPSKPDGREPGRPPGATPGRGGPERPDSPPPGRPQPGRPPFGAPQPDGPPFGGPQPRGPQFGGPPVPMMANPLIVALDADRNGEISADELKNAAAALATLDRNRDGKLTADEYRPQGFQPGFAGPRPSRPDGGPEGGPRPPRPEGGPDPQRMMEHAMSFDRDKDGKLDAGELRAFVDDFVRMQIAPGRPRP